MNLAFFFTFDAISLLPHLVIKVEIYSLILEYIYIDGLIINLYFSFYLIMLRLWFIEETLPIDQETFNSQVDDPMPRHVLIEVPIKVIAAGL